MSAAVSTSFDGVPWLVACALHMAESLTPVQFSSWAVATSRAYSGETAEALRRALLHTRNAMLRGDRTQAAMEASVAQAIVDRGSVCPGCCTPCGLDERCPSGCEDTEY